MKTIKYTLLPLVLTLFFIACGDDETNNRALMYIDSQSALVEFKMYVGSENGGVEADYEALRRKPEQLFPSTLFESYTSTNITFRNDLLLIEQSGVRESFIYKFENGSFFINKGGEFMYFGEGDHSTIDIRQHYIGFKTGEGNFTFDPAPPVKNIDKDLAAGQSKFESIEKMLNVEDTLMWVTRKAAFR